MASNGQMGPRKEASGKVNSYGDLTEAMNFILIDC
jgi:hypothetical protein